MEEKNSTKIQDVFLGLALLSGNMAATLLCAAILLTTKRLLSGWMEMVCMLMGGALSLGLMTIYFCLESPMKESGGKKVKRHWADVLEAELWILTAAGLCGLLHKGWERIRERLSGDAIWDMAAFVLLALVTAAVTGMLLHGLLRKCGLEGTEKPAIQVLRLFGILFPGLLLLKITAEIWTFFAAGREPSLAGMLAFHLFVAYCEYGIVKLLLVVARKKREKSTAEEKNGIAQEVSGEAAEAVENEKINTDTGIPGESSQAEKKAVSGKRRAFGVGIPLVLTLALAVAGKADTLFSASVEEKVRAVLEVPLQEAYDALEAGNLEKAIQKLSLAEARAGVFESVVEEDTDVSLYDIYRAYPDDIVVGTIYLSAAGELEEAEERVRNQSLGRGWYPVLLRYYESMVSPQKSEGEESTEEPEIRELTETQAILREELLWWCAGREEFAGENVIFAQDLSGKKFAVMRMLKDYETTFAAGRILQFVVQYGTQGGYTEALAYEALELAEAEPDNLFLQYVAWQAGSHFQEDGANHYDRTVDAAQRFDLLYDNGTRTVEQLAEEKRLLGDAALRCYAYDAAFGYYEEAYELSGDSSLALLCGEILEKQKKYAECADMAARVLAQEPENARALYLTAIASLKTGDVDGALEAAGKMGDLLADKDRKADQAEENNFYVCVQYLAMSDSGSWTDYSWQVYSSLSEEQIQAVQSHALLWDYMTAVYQCFMKEDYEAAEAAVEEILAVRDDLAMAWYLRGTIAFGGKDFEKALEFFRRAEACGSAAPALYFSIANTYDALEDYENAWIYARKVEEMLPYQDHGNDVYGISIHNKKLLNAIEKLLGR